MLSAFTRAQRFVIFSVLAIAVASARSAQLTTALPLLTGDGARSFGAAAESAHGCRADAGSADQLLKGWQ